MSADYGWTARELIAERMCSAPCLLAAEPDGACSCICGGEFHGMLCDAAIKVCRPCGAPLLADDEHGVCGPCREQYDRDVADYWSRPEVIAEHEASMRQWDSAARGRA